jgi:hypothetical protein
MRWIAQELSPCRHRLQDAAPAFDAQIGHDVRFVSHVAHQGLGLVGVEIVGHKVPAASQMVGLDRLLDMIGKVFFGPGVIPAALPYQASSARWDACVPGLAPRSIRRCS